MFKKIKHAVIRRKAKINEVPTSRFSVRLASTAKEYEMAFNLVHVSYAYLGIESLGEKMFRVTDQHLLPHTHVLLAWEGERLVGTMTVTLDSPGGLPLDKDYPEVVGPLRQAGAKLAEMGSFAVVQKRRRAGVAQLLALAAGRLIWSTDATHLIISVDPKVADIYGALYGFEACSPPQHHVELDMSIMAMITTREGQAAHLARYGGVHRGSGRTLEDLLIGPFPIPNSDVESSLNGHGRRRRLPRETFQRLFMEKSQALGGLNQTALDYVRSIRSDETLGIFADAPLSTPVDEAQSQGALAGPNTKQPVRGESGLMWLQ